MPGNQTLRRRQFVTPVLVL